MSVASTLVLALLWAQAGPPQPQGEVVLPLEEYNRLAELALSHGLKDTPPPVLSTVRTAAYSVSASGALARVRLQATVDVLGNAPLEQPLLGSLAALLSLKVDGQAAGARVDGEHYAVTLKPGTHTVDMEVVVPVESEGPSTLNLGIPEALSARLTAELPGKGWQVQVDGVNDLAVRRDGGNTVVSAALPVLSNLSLSWVKQGADDLFSDEESDPVPEKSTTPGKARATVLHHLAVDESVLRGTVKATLSIQKGTRQQASLTLPANVEVLDVQSADVREWTANKDGDVRRVLVTFKYGRTGDVPITVRYERALGETGEKSSVDVPEAVVLDVDAERGFLGIETAPGVEVTLGKTEGAEALDGRDLPGDLWSMSGTPLVLGVKYLEHPVKVALSISQRAKVAVADTTLDRARFETVVNAEGRAVSAVNYDVRNHQRQYLEVRLPKDTEVLSCFVNGKPQRPARGQQDTLFIPLDRSTAAEGSGAAFPVELVIAQQTGKVWPLSSLRLEMPSTAVQAMELSWRVYVPNSHVALTLGGNFSLQHDARTPDRWFSALISDATMAHAGGQSKADLLEGYDMSQGVKARWAPRMQELQVATAVRVSRPLVGRLYDFRANLLRAEAPRVAMTLVKRNVMEGLGNALSILALLAGLAAAERHRRKTPTFLPQGATVSTQGRLVLLRSTVLPAVAAAALVVNLLVGLYVDDVVADTLLGLLLAPTWLTLGFMRTSLRKGNRFWGWPMFLAAAGFLGLAFMAALAGRSVVASAMLLGLSAVSAVAARKVFWRPRPSSAPPSGQPLPAASSKEGGAA